MLRQGLVLWRRHRFNAHLVNLSFALDYCPLWPGCLRVVNGAGVELHNVPLPLGEVLSQFFLAIPLLVISTPLEIDYEITFLPHAVVGTSHAGDRISTGRRRKVVRVHPALINQNQLGQDCWMPLHQVFERMCLGFLKCIRTVQGIEPGIEEILGPAVRGGGRGRGVANYEGSVGKVVRILTDDQACPRGLDSRERMDDRIGGNHRDILVHQRLERLQDVLF